MTKRKLDARQQTFGLPDEDLNTSLHDEIVLWVKRDAEEICRQLIGWTETWDAQLIESNRQRAAETVADRISLLQKSLTTTKQRLHIGNHDQSRLCLGEDLEKQIKALEGELAYLNAWKGLGEPPARKLRVQCELEQPILRRQSDSTQIVGFIDAVLSVWTLQLSAGNAPSDDYGRAYLGVDASGYTDWKVQWSRFRSFAFDAKSTIPSLGELIRQFKTYRVYSPKLPFYIVSPHSHFAKHIAEEGFGFIKYPDGTITFPKTIYR